jgi:hypothetical protein
MYQNYIHRHNNRGERFKGEEVDSVLQELESRENLTPWEQHFLGSIRKGYNKYGSLTEGQYHTLVKVAKRNDPAVKKEIQDWRDSYNEEMRETAKIMARYYKNNPPYFHDLASKILEEDDYIPSKKAYAAMCENKYAQRVLETARAEPLYLAGQMAVIRKGSNVPTSLSRLSGKMVIVLENIDEVVNSAKNAKQCRVMVVGGDRPFIAEERWLKKLPKKLR